MKTIIRLSAIAALLLSVTTSCTAPEIARDNTWVEPDAVWTITPEERQVFVLDYLTRYGTYTVISIKDEKDENVANMVGEIGNDINFLNKRLLIKNPKNGNILIDEPFELILDSKKASSPFIIKTDSITLIDLYWDINETNWFKGEEILKYIKFRVYSETEKQFITYHIEVL